mmetsp:Transcript_11448/g.33239  ORF Transcript_11448/g.33239 Transcript_11448/m.33239 type:complete len:356 (+) Transcript_11448:216-1283(+)
MYTATSCGPSADNADADGAAAAAAGGRCIPGAAAAAAAAVADLNVTRASALAAIPSSPMDLFVEEKLEEWKSILAEQGVRWTHFEAQTQELAFELEWFEVSMETRMKYNKKHLESLQDEPEDPSTSDLAADIAKARQHVEDTHADIHKLIVAVSEAEAKRAAYRSRLQGLIDDNEDLRQRDADRLTKEKLDGLTSIPAVMQFQWAATSESARLKQLRDQSNEHLMKLRDESYQKDVEGRLAAAKEAKDREAAEQLRKEKEAAAKMIADMQAQLKEERAKHAEGGGKDKTITTCVVCLAEPNDIALVPCGHQCLCKGCLERMKDTAKKDKKKVLTYPVCRAKAKSAVHVYNQGHRD